MSINNKLGMIKEFFSSVIKLLIKEVVWLENPYDKDDKKSEIIYFSSS